MWAAVPAVPGVLALAVGLATVAVRAGDYECLGSTSGLPQWLPACSWYSGSACCVTSDQVSRVAETVGTLRRTYNATLESNCTGNDATVGRQCLAVLQLLHCGIHCSPRQRSFASSGVALVCPKFAALVHSRCSSWMRRGSPSETCKRISDAYPSPSSLVASLSFQLGNSTYAAKIADAYQEADGKCFSASSVPRPSLCIMFLVYLAIRVVRLATAASSLKEEDPRI